MVNKIHIPTMESEINNLRNREFERNYGIDSYGSSLIQSEQGTMSPEAKDKMDQEYARKEFKSQRAKDELIANRGWFANDSVYSGTTECDIDSSEYEDQIMMMEERDYYNHPDRSTNKKGKIKFTFMTYKANS